MRKTSNMEKMEKKQKTPVEGLRREWREAWNKRQDEPAQNRANSKPTSCRLNYLEARSWEVCECASGCSTVKSWVGQLLTLKARVVMAIQDTRESAVKFHLLQTLEFTTATSVVK